MSVKRVVLEICDPLWVLCSCSSLQLEVLQMALLLTCIHLYVICLKCHEWWTVATQSVYGSVSYLTLVCSSTGLPITCTQTFTGSGRQGKLLFYTFKVLLTIINTKGPIVNKGRTWLYSFITYFQFLCS